MTKHCFELDAFIFCNDWSTLLPYTTRNVVNSRNHARRWHAHRQPGSVLQRFLSVYNDSTCFLTEKTCVYGCNQLRLAERSSWKSILDAHRATSIATATLESCDHTSVTRNGRPIEWINASHAATTACTSITLVSEGRQRIVVCYRTVIKKLTKLRLVINFRS